MADKPLHVQVAEVMGWTSCHFAPNGNRTGWGGTDEPAWVGTQPDSPMVNVEVPHYDTDWSATGPLIEKYAVSVCPASKAWWSASWPGSEDINQTNFSSYGPTPLIALCNLILALHKAGGLP